MNREFRVGSHEPRNVWHDPEGVNKPLVIPGERTGTMVCFARDEFWAARIAEALDLLSQKCGALSPVSDRICDRSPHPDRIAHHFVRPEE